MCDCYKIGGPFIAEDPDCPVHGIDAQVRERIANEEKESIDSRIAELEARVAAMESVIARILPTLNRLSQNPNA